MMMIQYDQPLIKNRLVLILLYTIMLLISLVEIQDS